jgi:hypothetical protein
MGFQQVKAILDQALADWTQQRGGQVPDLTGHGPGFSWQTKQDLLNAVGHGFRLIQPEMINNNKGDQTNLVIDLRTGIGGVNRMPKGGPFISPTQIQVIVDWINAGCPD